MTKQEMLNELSGLEIDDLGELKNDSLQKLITLRDQAAKAQELEGDVKSLQGINTKLNARLESTEKSAPKERKQVKIKGKTYEITVAKATYKGKEINAEVLSRDNKLAEELVKIKAGFLKEVEG